MSNSFVQLYESEKSKQKTPQTKKILEKLRSYALTKESLNTLTFKLKPYLSLNQHQSAPISINQNQTALNHQVALICIHHVVIWPWDEKYLDL